MRVIGKIIAIAIAILSTASALSGCGVVGGLQSFCEIGITDTKDYSFEIWLSNRQFFMPDHKDFFVKKTFFELASSFDNKKDRIHGGRIKAQIYHDKYILITQEAVDGKENFYLVDRNSNEYPESREGEYRYNLFLPKATFASGCNKISVPIPYHLLTGIEAMHYPPAVEYAYHNSITCEIEPETTAGDIFDFYERISTCTVEKLENGDFRVFVKTNNCYLNISIYDLSQISFMLTMN